MNRPSRRDVLAWCGAAGTTALSGCQLLSGLTEPACDPATAAADTTLASAGWPIYRGTPTNAAFRPTVEGPDIGSVDELQETLLHIGDGYMAVVDGVVYFADDEGATALDATSGSLRWRTSTIGQAGVPTVATETVYLSPDDGGVWALDRETGEPRWRSVESRSLSRPVPGDGVVLVADGQGTVYGLDPRCGDRQWRVETADTGGTGIAVGPSAAAVAAGSTVRQFDPATGEVRWQFDLPGGDEITWGFVLAGETLLVGGDDGPLTAIDWQDGTERWVLDTTARIGWVQPAATDDVVLCRGTQREDPSADLLLAFDFETGAKRWEFQTQGRHYAVVSRGVLLVGYDEIYYLDPQSGAVHQRVEIGRGYFRPEQLAVTDDAIYLRMGFEATTHLRRYTPE